jgi:hypothetical protein
MSVNRGRGHQGIRQQGIHLVENKEFKLLKDDDIGDLQLGSYSMQSVRDVKELSEDQQVQRE